MQVSLLIAAALITAGSHADASLSILENRVDGCHWLRVNAERGATKDIAMVASSCAGAFIQSSPDESRAVFFRPSGNGDQEVSIVTVDTGQIQKLRLPPRGQLKQAQVDFNNDVRAITSSDHTMSWTLRASGEWEETGNFKEPWPGPEPMHCEWGPIVLKAKLPAALQAMRNFTWKRIGLRSPAIYGRMRTGTEWRECGDDSNYGGAFTLGKSGKVAELEPKNADVIQLREHWLLVRSSKEKAVRIYDTTNMSVLLDRRNVESASFWPIPSKP